MKQNQITPAMHGRFGKIDKFVEKVGRMPVNREIGKMFNLSLGSATLRVLQKYSEYKKVEFDKSQKEIK